MRKFLKSKIYKINQQFFTISILFLLITNLKINLFELNNLYFIFGFYNLNFDKLSNDNNI